MHHQSLDSHASQRKCPRRALNVRFQTLPRSFSLGKAKTQPVQREWDSFHFDPTPFPADSLIYSGLTDDNQTQSSDGRRPQPAEANTYEITWLEFELKPLPDSSFFQSIDEVAIEDLYAKHAGQENFFQDGLSVARTALANRMLQKERAVLHRHNSPVSLSAMDLSTGMPASASLAPTPPVVSDNDGKDDGNDDNSDVDRDRRGRFRTFLRATTQDSSPDGNNRLLLSAYVLVASRKGELVPQLVVLSNNALHLTAARSTGSLAAFQRTRQIWFENVRGVSLLSRHGSNFFVLHVFKGFGRLRSRTDYLMWTERKPQLLVALAVAIRSCLNVPLRAVITNQLQIRNNNGFLIDLRVVDLPNPDLPSKVLRHGNSLQSFQTIETTIIVSRPVHESRQRAIFPVV